jgi:UDP-N-acetylmuramoyl-tripeptide--D-alanyl-D-alanine ligase
MIDSILLSELAVATQGELQGKDIEFSAVSIDTRTLSHGDLYIALKGEQFDGHQFMDQAIDKGCAALVVSDLSIKSQTLSERPYLIVSDTLNALGECARINRERFSGPVIGLTGSSGKTSTKNMLECILQEKGKTCATQGNFNNEVGVPLTLLSITEQHQFAVVEMGARKLGDIRYLSRFVQPDVAILLNAGTAHIDIFGSQENIAKAKGEIFTELKPGSAAVVNLDDPANKAWLVSLKGKAVLTFSLDSANADIFATGMLCDDTSCRFDLNYRGMKQTIHLPVPGQHNILNSLAASAAAIHLGFDLSEIAQGLEKLSTVAGRLMSIPCSEGLMIIDDSYNANPASMKAALDVLALRTGFKVAVLGEMAELGDFSRKLHLELAKYIATSLVDRVYLIGAHAQEMAELIGSKAIASDSKAAVLESLEQLDHIFDEHEAYNELVKTSILIKGSRSTAMDELVDMIIKRAH